MLNLIQNLISRALLSIVPAIIWTFFTYIIIYIKNKDISEQHMNIFNDLFIANYILIFLATIIFIKENLLLF